VSCASGLGDAIGGTRDQDLLVVHGTAIQGYGGARMTCSMVKDLALDRPLTNGRSEQGLKARAGVEVVVKHEKPHSDRRFQVRGCLEARERIHA
jgi:hypothetical protein